MTTIEYFPKEECLHRGFYRLASRNLTSGVWDAYHMGFIGIRQKFDIRYLFMEYHFDNGAPYGTAFPTEYMEEDLPFEIELKERLKPSIDQVTARPVEFDRPIKDGGRGWFFLDTGEASEEIRPKVVNNKELFYWLNSRTV